MTETQHLFAQAQAFQQQLQGILIQKEGINNQLLEIKNALEELVKVKDREVYKLSGPIMIKTPKAELKKELQEKQEIMELRIKTLEKGEAKAKEKLEEIKEKLSKTDNIGAG